MSTHENTHAAGDEHGGGTPTDARGLARTVVSRRGFLRTTGAAAGAAVIGGTALQGTAFAAPPVRGTATFTPVRPPAVPLAVRSPYTSTWQDSDNLAGDWPRIWFGAITAMAGLVRIDGTTYVFMGAPGLPGRPPLPAMQQTAFVLTPTASTYTFAQAGVELTATFLSPVEPGDLRRQSIPLSYLSLSARSTDSTAHDVAVYVDISGEWVMPDHGDTPITWQREALPGSPAVVSLVAQRRDQNPLNAGSPDDDAQWGSVVWSAAQRAGTTSQIGPDAVVRAAFADTGALDGSVDPNFRNINDRYPVFAHSAALGSVRRATAPLVLSIGHVHTPAIQYLDTPLLPLWTASFASRQAMVSFFHSDYAAAVSRAASLDKKVTGDAQRAGGTAYAAICALSLRQAYAGTELVLAPDGKTPWAFLKEISSDGNVSTIDVMYPAMPVWDYLDPQYLGVLLAPIFDYVEKHDYPKPFAPHDLGAHYPQATGHLDGTGEEDMPVEESANMLIMAAAYMRHSSTTASAFAKQHYTILKQWADYLVANALDPQFQNQTDDFTGFIAHSVNLALKGIVGIGAMSQVATAAGQTADAASYLRTARDYIGQWQTKAQDPTGPHLMLAYGDTGTWSLKYNGFADKLLGLGLVPSSVADEEAAWYLSHTNTYGVPLDVRDTLTKGDWEMWTAAWLSDHKTVRDTLIARLYQFANTTPSRIPFTDLYDTVSDKERGFRARPVVGGMFALLALQG